MVSKYTEFFKYYKNLYNNSEKIIVFEYYFIRVNVKKILYVYLYQFLKIKH